MLLVRSLGGQTPNSFAVAATATKNSLCRNVACLRGFRTTSGLFDGAGSMKLAAASTSRSAWLRTRRRL